MISLYSGIIPIIKQAAIDAVNSTQPVQIVFGMVTSESPLKVRVNPKLILGKGNLVVAGSLSKKSVSVNLPEASGSVKIDNTLKKGDPVIMLRIQGGNKYLVLDKVVEE